jgi:uncharacterized membrane protein
MFIMRGRWLGEQGPRVDWSVVGHCGSPCGKCDFEARTLSLVRAATSILSRALRFRLSASMALLLLIMPPSSANQPERPEPGRAYKVVGVSASDLLNVRSQAAISAQIVDNLRFDATAITVTGVSQRGSDATWWQIIQPTVGWVNSRFLALADDSNAEPMIGFSLWCTGTEPFWSLEIEGEHARFKTPEGDQASWTASGWRLAAGQRPGHRFAIQLGADGTHAVGWAALWRPQQFCTDGMSNLEFPYEVIVTTPTGRDLAGCCARARD